MRLRLVYFKSVFLAKYERQNNFSRVFYNLERLVIGKAEPLYFKSWVANLN